MSEKTKADSKPRASNRGFAGMDPAKQREISSKGGKAAHEKGTAHQFSSEEAKEAGRRGGETVSQDREHMAKIGRAGGRAKRQITGSRKDSRLEEANRKAASE